MLTLSGRAWVLPVRGEKCSITVFERLIVQVERWLSGPSACWEEVGTGEGMTGTSRPLGICSLDVPRPC